MAETTKEQRERIRACLNSYADDSSPGSNEMRCLLADAERAEQLEAAMQRMLSEETDWEDGEIGVGFKFRAIARAALAGAKP